MTHKFSKNSKYYTIALYSIAVVIICTFIIKLIINWDSTSSMISNTISILMPFIAGIFIAYLIYPLSKTISQKVLHPIMKQKFLNFQKIFAIILSYIIVLGLIITALFYIFPQLIDSFLQLSTIFNSAQSGYNKLLEIILEIEKQYALDLSSFNGIIQEIPGKLFNIASSILPRLLPTIYNTSMNVLSGVLNIIIAIIVSIYLLIDKNQLLNNGKRLLYAIFGAKKGDKILITAKECNKIFGNFIIGKMIDSLIIGILCFIAMSILKLPYVLIVSVIVGVTNMIPYFGPFIGAIPGILFLLIVDLKYALIFTVLIIILQQFDGLVLGPKILGDSTGLRPVWIIFAITIGGSVAGVVGMFLGVPTVAVIAYLANNLINRKLKQKDIVLSLNEETGILTRIEEIPIQQEDTPSEQNADTTDKSEL